MPYDKDICNKVAEKARNRAKKESVAAYSMEFLRQSAVQSEKLTQYEEWNKYLSYIQNSIDGLNTSIELARTKLEDPRVLDNKDLMAAKIVIIESQAMIKAFTIAINYPTEILKLHKSLEDACAD